MKTWLLGALAIVLFLILIGGIFLLFRLPTPKKESVPPTQQALVSTLEHDVFITTVTNQKSVVLGSTTTQTGSSVTTSATGRALVDIEGVRSVLDYNTVALLEGTTHKNTLELSTGAIWSRVQKILGQGEFYQIQTQNAVAVVRGTSFGVSYVNTTSTLVVTEGTVSFLKRDPETGVIDSASEVKVTAGQKAYRVGMGAVVVEPSSKADKVLPWFLFNNTPTSPVVAPASLIPSSSTPVPSAQTSTQSTTLTPTPAPAATDYALTLSSLSPNSVQQGATTKIQITGTALTHLDALFVGGILLTFHLINDTTVSASVSQVPAGVYDVQAIDAKNRTTLLKQALTITAPSRPTQTTPTAGTKP